MLASALGFFRRVGISLRVKLAVIDQVLGQSGGSWLERKFANDLVKPWMYSADEGYQCS